MYDFVARERLEVLLGIVETQARSGTCPITPARVRATVHRAELGLMGLVWSFDESDDDSVTPSSEDSSVGSARPFKLRKGDTTATLEKDRSDLIAKAREELQDLSKQIDAVDMSLSSRVLEELFTQLMCKVDGVMVMGDSDLRFERKQLIRTIEAKSACLADEVKDDPS